MTKQMVREIRRNRQKEGIRGKDGKDVEAGAEEEDISTLMVMLLTVTICIRKFCNMSINLSLTSITITFMQ